MEIRVDQKAKVPQPEQIEQEQTPFSELSETLGKVDGAIQDITAVKLSPEQESRLRTIQRKVVNGTKRFSRVMGRLVAIGSIIAVTNYGITHSNLETTRDESGAITYMHEDERTTHYLNVLAGIEDFTIEDQLVEERGFIEFMMRGKGAPVPDSIKSMSMDQLDSYVSTHNEYFKPGSLKKENEEWRQRVNGRNIASSSEGKNFYNLVWQLEQEAGNPRIRFTAENIYFTPSSTFQGENHYDQIGNIIYITSYEFVDPKSLMAEMSHGKQFKDSPIGSCLRGARDWINVVRRGGLSIKGMTEEYEKLYKTPGSIEHEAHEIIQKDLEGRYPLISMLQQKAQERK